MNLSLWESFFDTCSSMIPKGTNLFYVPVSQILVRGQESTKDRAKCAAGGERGRRASPKFPALLLLPISLMEGRAELTVQVMTAQNLLTDLELRSSVT